MTVICVASITRRTNAEIEAIEAAIMEAAEIQEPLTARHSTLQRGSPCSAGPAKLGTLIERPTPKGNCARGVVVRFQPQNQETRASWLTPPSVTRITFSPLIAIFEHAVVCVRPEKFELNPSSRLAKLLGWTP